MKLREQSPPHRLSGLLDLEASHHSFQVADFALSWRGYQDEVILGYDEVRPLSDLEWRMIRPVYHAWLFMCVAANPRGSWEWELAHFRKESELIR